MTCILMKTYVMQTKLTLRVDKAVVRKAKLLARQKGTSVSRIFGDYISRETEVFPEEELPPITSSMLGIIKREGVEIDEDSHKKHLEEKYL